MERQVPEQEAALPIEEYVEKKGLSRHAVGQYVKLGQMETGKVKGETSVIDLPAKPETNQKTADLPTQDTQTESIAELIQAAKMDWIHFGIIQAQAKSKTRWQTYAFFLTVLFVGVLLANIWLYMDRAMYAGQLDEVMQELGAAKMKLTTVSADLDKINQLQAENNQLAFENAALRAQNIILSNKVESFNESVPNDTSESIAAAKTPQVEPLNQQEEGTSSNQISKSTTSKTQEGRLLEIELVKNTQTLPETLNSEAEQKPVKNVLDELQRNEQEKQKRIIAIQKGLYPTDMTKEELIASLGEPDRIYQGPVYEQLVYFNHPSHRFWFKNGPFVERIE